jgi:hypothetical protein
MARAAVVASVRLVSDLRLLRGSSRKSLSEQKPLFVRNQGDTSLCWLHSALQMMEQMAGTRLSIDALLIPEIRSRALDRFLGYETPWDGGAGPTRPFALAIEHGLILDSAWASRQSIVNNYAQIFSDIEALLAGKQATSDQNAVDKFITAVDEVIVRYTGSLPPKQFMRNGQMITAVDYAKQVIGDGHSIGIDFRNITYNDRLFGRLPEVAWTTIISRDNHLKKITDVIGKTTLRVSGEEAFDRAVEIFESKRPVAFTFIYYDEKGEATFKVNNRAQFVSARSPVEREYLSSHLVLISGVIYDSTGAATGFEVLDPLVLSGSGIRVVPKKFFLEHGKTVHEIGVPCSAVLRMPLI